MVALAKTVTVRGWQHRLDREGCQIEGSWDVGHLKAYDGDTVVYTALQKGHGGPWIVRTANSDRISWQEPVLGSQQS
jgi:hypothetical protein